MENDTHKEPVILYEDESIVAINKPAGLITHSDGRTEEETAEEWFKRKYPQAGEEAGYVHRLDRDTSGVLIFAKTPEAYHFLRKAFHDREVKKTYLAFVYGAPKEKSGTIDFAIGRSRRDFRLRSAQPKAKGRLREAITHFEVLGEAGEGEERYALMTLHPETGRTHQIRVHLKAIHHPIVADPLYAPKKENTLGLTHLGLHAYSIDLPLPNGDSACIIASLPEEFEAALRHFPEAIETFALGKGAC